MHALRLDADRLPTPRADGDREALRILLGARRELTTAAHTGALYDDPGADYYTRRDPERTRRNAVNQLQRLGYQVTLTPTAATA